MHFSRRAEEMSSSAPLRITYFSLSSSFVPVNPHSAVVEYGNVVGDTLHIRCDMCGEKDASVFVLDVLRKYIKELIPGNRVKSAGRLVKYHEVSLVGQCDSYHEFHFHAL